MATETTLFEDIMQGLAEIEAYEAGQLELRETTIEIAETDELLATQSLYNKIHNLPLSAKLKASQYVDELLHAMGGFAHD